MLAATACRRLGSRTSFTARQQGAVVPADSAGLVGELQIPKSRALRNFPVGAGLYVAFRPASALDTFISRAVHQRSDSKIAYRDRGLEFLAYRHESRRRRYSSVSLRPRRGFAAGDRRYGVYRSPSANIRAFPMIESRISSMAGLSPAIPSLFLAAALRRGCPGQPGMKRSNWNQLIELALRAPRRRYRPVR